jgi:hypothetical protein
MRFIFIQELRMAYILSGRELTSDEMLQNPQQGLPPPSFTAVNGRPSTGPLPAIRASGGGLFGTPAVRPF